ncbi:MAG: translation elongation factor Ts [Gemmatimonas sp.]|uniref:translation elongation factor Ts n=1 Tax=Gemmatimonas sp. TaxID=1962908 RepID=UPI00391EE415|nr:translation elongation factor Ts [Gemmatimonadota bacterium]
MTTAISAKAVSELRQRTGAGMMDCKKALEENSGDMDAAIEYLRKKGIAKAEKRSDRSTSEGIVGGEVFNNGASGALVEVACETDFVARNEDFGKIVAALVAQRVQSTAGDIAAFLAEPMSGDTGTVDEFVKAAAAKTGEAVNVKRTVRFDAGANGLVGMYRHHNAKLGTLVQITTSSPEVAQHEATKELAKFIAEHVAAAAPIAVDRSGVSAEKLESEKRIAEEQAREAGKPEAMIEKIATGKVEAYLKDVTLMPQPWVRDAAVTIAQLVADHAKKAGGTITVDRFARLQLGAE